MTYGTIVHVELSPETFRVARARVEESGLGKICNVYEFKVPRENGDVDFVEADFEFDRLCLRELGNSGVKGYSEIPGVYPLFCDVTNIIASGNVRGSSCSMRFSSGLVN